MDVNVFAKTCERFALPNECKDYILAWISTSTGKQVASERPLWNMWRSAENKSLRQDHSTLANVLSMLHELLAP
jgi:hypothetical protein